MKNNIPEFLQDKFKGRSAVVSKFPDEIKEFLYNYAKFYNWNIKDNLQNVYLMIQKGFSDLPKCEYAGCPNPVRIINSTKISRGCCRAHSQKIENLEKYGVENVKQLETVKEKTKQTCLKKFGETTNLKTKETKERIKITNLNRYGVEYTMQSEQLRAKRTKTFQKKYGVDEITSSKHFKKVCMERYGVENPTLNSELLDKAQQNAFNRKEYIWKSGDVSIVQGYEPIVLSELEEQGYSFNDILTSTNDMPEIWYNYNDKKHRYYPDFYIPSENLIIEVKSEWTLNGDLSKNNAKFEAVKALGFNFRLEVR